MLSRDLYCAACGLPFDSGKLNIRPKPDYETFELFYNEEIVSSEQVEWLNRFRVLTDKRDYIPLDLSPSIGFADTSIYLSKQAGWTEFTRVSFDNSGKEYSVFASPFLLPLHEHCLQIASQVCIYNRITEVNGIKSLGDLYYAVAAQQERSVIDGNYSDSGGIYWDHKYYGARDFWGQGWDCEEGFEWIVADPLDVEGLKNLFENANVRNVEKKTFDIMKIDHSTIETLPSPAIECLASFMSIPSIICLKSSSKLLYNTLPLSQSFWAGRINSGEVVPWIWDAHVDKKTFMENRTDTEAVAMWLNKGVEELPIGLRNRMRIWKILKSIK